MIPSTPITAQTGVADGVLIVNKEAGWTSHDVVAKVRGLLGGVKVGHAGTLDPAATGVLPLLIGRATRIAEYLVGWDKEYRAVLRLGETTDTQDATGTVLQRVEASGVGPEVLRNTVARFVGPQKQMPPMYSAVKVAGRPLYKSARAGQTVERAERDIVIHALEALAVDGRDITLRVVCSKGTYIRTLCADMGETLGVGGHLLSLERRRVGALSIDEALTVEQIATQLAIGTLGNRLWSLDRVLEQLPLCTVTEQEASRVLHGAPIAPSGWSGVTEPSTVRLKDGQGRLLAIGTYDPQAKGPIKIQKVLVDVESLN
ncbi:tRNA pseudouridine(55) synthase TruB [Nitrospira sp. NS4]|uniref:tRNA pseudouridine(55) synthase TruB n=1 Tax=Nitrospira sp. NS4 TaxID=3414498 RepID=UPI003C2B86E0